MSMFSTIQELLKQCQKTQENTHFLIKKTFFFLSLNFLNIMLEIRLRFSEYSS